MIFRRINIFSILLYLIFFLSSCVSELKDTEDNPTIFPESKICCMEARLDSILPNDSTKKNTRGWGGLTATDEYATTIYPLETLYLHVQKGRGQWGTLPIPVQKNGDKRYISLCYRADENGDVYAISDGQELLVGPDKKCFFSSTPTVRTSCDQSTIKTPGNKTTYEPYGDRLFRSENLYFSYEGDDFGDMKIQSIWEKDKLAGEWPQPVEESFTQLRIFRATFVIIPRLIICDGYPDPDSNSDKGGKYVLNKDTLEKRLGPIGDWSVQFFMAGDYNPEDYKQDDYPIDVDISYISPDWKGYILGKTSNSKTKGVIAISEKPLNLREIDQQSTNNAGYKNEYYGYGIHDSSYSFIYKGDISTQQFTMCCTLLHKVKKDGKITTEARTIRFPMVDLSINDIHTLSYVIDVDEIAQAFGLGQKTGKSIQCFYDSDFGEIADIPAILIEE